MRVQSPSQSPWAGRAISSPAVIPVAGDAAAAATPLRVSARLGRIAVGVATVELALLYAPTIAWLWGRWTASVWEHAHGLLIVPVVLYFISQELRPLAGRPPSSSPWGFVLLAPALALHVLDTGMHTQLLSAASLLLAAPGLSLLALGIERTRAIAFPLALLAFALPIPLAFTEQMHWQLRQLVTATTGWALPMLGIPVFTEGTTIVMPSASLEIADACSGFTTLYAATAVALLTAYTTRSNSRRVLVLLSAVPLAVAANLLRVMALALLVVWRGPAILDTFVHPLSGLMTFALALPIIFWLGGDLRSPASRNEARA